MANGTLCFEIQKNILEPKGTICHILPFIPIFFVKKQCIFQ